jgi:hypothetical protein
MVGLWDAYTAYKTISREMTSKTGYTRWGSHAETFESLVNIIWSALVFWNLWDIKTLTDKMDTNQMSITKTCTGRVSNQGTCSRVMMCPLLTTTKSTIASGRKWDYSHMEANNIIVIMWMQYERSNKYTCIFKIHENYVCLIYISSCDLCFLFQ